ncbi:MAG: ATP-dependent DNA helicase RecG [Aurantimicrobium sp.]|nr:ATP-dependent DNA helicase RecG [Aurantimicrobium sp.]
MNPSPLDAKLDALVGGKTATALAKAFGMKTVGDLVGHFPRRYAKRGELTAVADVPLDENVSIVAEVLDVRSRPMRAKRGSILEVRLTDGSGGTITLTFFNQAWRERDLAPGSRGIFAGKVSRYRGTLQLAHPDYELFDDNDTGTDADSGIDMDAEAWAKKPLPLYAATSTFSSWQMAKTIALVLPTLGDLADPLEGVLSDAERTERDLLPFAEALRLVHQPAEDRDWQRARDTLRFIEALVLQAALLERRAEARSHRATPRPAKLDGMLARFDAALPFSLTGDQQLVGAEIAHDIAADVPMSRLVQGEVGSGKTLVALRAMLQVADTGGQAVLLAPTEVLAAQHLRSVERVLGAELCTLLAPTLITGQLPVAQKRAALLRAAAGQAHIVIGTHALLQDNVQFFDLGLVVIDEQHRFGVEQRHLLHAKAENVPHTLVLTATPIPRTVAMTAFGDLDVSVIRELPAGRAGITSHCVALAEHPGWMSRVWERVAEELALGRQAFVVCPAIDAATLEEDDGDTGRLSSAEGAYRNAESGFDTSTSLTTQPAGASTSLTTQPADSEDAPKRLSAVTEVLEQLRALPVLAGRRIEALHGRLSSDEKDSIMRAFADGAIDVVVATTVIEVGVDVPNASTMVVLDADRFGVSQLHQLRGRVGRGGVPGLALFVTDAEPDTVARQRVEAVAATTDGFELARIDLELRAEGDVLGARQSGGRSGLRLLRVTRDGDLIAEVRDVAAGILADDPGFVAHPALREAMARRLDESERAFLDKN